MGLSLTQAVSRVATRLNKNANDTTVYNRIKNHINDACQEKWAGYAWSFRYREYPLVTTAQVTSGTMTATNDSQAVTASGTPFVVSAHTGAWIRFTGDEIDTWYRVQTVNSTSSITIEPPYQGTSGSGKAYELCKTDYLLPTELSDTGALQIQYNGYPVRPENIHQMDGWDTPPLTNGAPTRIGILRAESILSSYSTGTVSGTSSANVVTGAGTAWLSNVTPGDQLTINGDTNVYTVYKVDSDTQITLYNYLSATATTASYTLTKQFGRILRVWPCPDRAYVGFVKGLRSYSPLVSTIDTNELLCRYPTAVIESAVWREASSSPDPREDALYQKSELLWARAQGEDEALLPVQNRNPIFNPRARFNY
jgi:hypothetical protein